MMVEGTLKCQVAGIGCSTFWYVCQYYSEADKQSKEGQLRVCNRLERLWGAGGLAR